MLGKISDSSSQMIGLLQTESFAGGHSIGLLTENVACSGLPATHDIGYDREDVGSGIGIIRSTKEARASYATFCICAESDYLKLLFASGHWASNGNCTCLPVTRNIGHDGADVGSSIGAHLLVAGSTTMPSVK